MFARPAYVHYLARRPGRLDKPGIPEDSATKCHLEVPDGLHRNGIDELLMELRVSFAGRQAVLRSHMLLA
jgi:hypothetical protein